MDWITEQIAIGNYLDAIRHTADVDSILCLKPNCCEKRSDIDVYCLPLHDGSGNRREHVLAAIEFIAEQVSLGEKVLVHCHAGRSRSVAIVAAYLIQHHSISRTQALSMIADKRDIYFSDGIEEIFKCLRM